MRPVIGHLAVLDDKPMAEDTRGLAVLKIFAARAVPNLNAFKLRRSYTGR
jgi:hypothetical protein